jgi:DNA-nicking Smr family endonuclease
MCAPEKGSRAENLPNLQDLLARFRIGSRVQNEELGMDMRVPIEDSLDLHAFAPRDVQSVVAEYVTAAREAGFRQVRLIHGRGKGIQRGLVQRTLEQHPLVIEFWDAPETHLGATVALLAD